MTSSPPADPPLQGVQVLSLAEQYPGPYAGLLLADLGADVTLIERPRGGDPARQFPGFFDPLSRNKRSIAVDLKRPAGREVLLRLAETADVLLEGFRPGTMERLGLGHETLAARNARLVYVSVSGFGQDGPYRDRPGHDLSYQALAGLLHRWAERGEPAEPPSVLVGDLTAGTFAALAVMVGLLSRERSERGCYLDVAMLDVLVSWMTVMLGPVLNGDGPSGLPPEPAYRAFRTADEKLLTISISHEDRFWAALCRSLELHDLVALTAPERRADTAELARRLQARLIEHPCEHWERLLAAADVPFGRVNDLAGVLEDPQVRHRRLVEELDGKAPRSYVRQPLRMEGVRPPALRPAPTLGQHTEELLLQAGYRAGEIAELERDGAVVCAAQPPAGC